MNTLYLDIFSGISGDMFLGAALDLGVDFHRLETELKKLGLDGYHLHQKRGEKSGISGVKFDVHLEHEEHSHADHDHDHSHGGHGHRHHEEPAVQSIGFKKPASAQPHSHEHTHDHSHEHSHSHTDEHDDHGHPHSHEHSHDDECHDHDHRHEHGDHHHGRNFSDIRAMILGSSLSDWVKTKSIAVFQRVAVAEGKVHGRPPEEVHFHEVGAVDSIVDIVGACIALELLGKPRVLAASVVEGTGWVNCAHGRFPVPTTATLEILGARGIALTQCEEPHELVTPTGAALLAEFVERFGPMTGLIATKIGYGLGTRDNHTRPNVLRAVLGEVQGSASQTTNLDWETDRVAVLETNIDDQNPELLAHAAERLLAAGALDVFQTPVQMKKGRNGVLLTVLCAETDADKFTEQMLRETSAFGVRRSVTDRRKLKREFREVPTEFGPVSVKLALLNGQVVHAAPEFESCKKVATAQGIAVNAVYLAASVAIQAAKPI
jgi:pyridinium-3,5-bisthiocarboxylic acid mononucleotide nickel chelatase